MLEHGVWELPARAEAAVEALFEVEAPDSSWGRLDSIGTSLVALFFRPFFPFLSPSLSFFLFLHFFNDKLDSALSTCEKIIGKALSKIVVFTSELRFR